LGGSLYDLEYREDNDDLKYLEVTLEEARARLDASQHRIVDEVLSAWQHGKVVAA
jgi:hypothetical protein